MLSNFLKYLLTLIFVCFGLASKAQEDSDSTLQNYLDSNISIKSFQNNDLIFVKQVLSNQRIILQSTFDKREAKMKLEEVSHQTSNLEKTIIHYVKMNHKVIVNEMDMQKTNVDSELLLARLIYIKSKTWCMEQRLQRRVKKLYEDSKSNEFYNKNMVETFAFTENVMMSLGKAKRLDRMKYRYNQKIVISNWELTANRLKENDKKINNFDVEFKKQYRYMLVDLFTMIGVLAMF